MRLLANPLLCRRLLVASLVFLTLAALVAWTLDWHHGLPYDRHGYVLGRDFLNFWMAGRAFWHPDPGRFYDPGTYEAALQSFLGVSYHQRWSYPPGILLLAAPFGLLGYLPALALWVALSAGVIVFAMAKLRLSRLGMVLTLLSPAAVCCIVSGQGSFLCAALIVGGFRLRRTHPWLAGILIGLLSLKPHLGLLFPVLLLAERNWRSLLSAAWSGGAIAGLVTLVHGPALWQQYLRIGVPNQAEVLTSAPVVLASTMPTLYADLRLVGLPDDLAMGAQIILALAAALMVYAYFRDVRTGEKAFLLFASASALATPYLMLYDLMPLTVALVLLTHRRRLNDTQEVLTVAGFALPALRFATAPLPLFGPSLIPLAILAWSWRTSPPVPSASLPAAEPPRE